MILKMKPHTVISDSDLDKLEKLASSQMFPREGWKKHKNGKDYDSGITGPAAFIIVMLCREIKNLRARVS